MTSKTLILGAVIAMSAVLATRDVPAVEKHSETLKGIPPETVADFLHAVIMAHRDFYTTHRVNRWLQEGVVEVSEDWRATNSLPLPVQFLKETSEMAELTGAKVRYHVISQWPINKA